MPYQFHRRQGFGRRHVGPGFEDGSHGQIGLRQVIPADGAGVLKGPADDALNALVHGGMRARAQAKEKPPPQMAESGEGSYWPGVHLWGGDPGLASAI